MSKLFPVTLCDSTQQGHFRRATGDRKRGRMNQQLSSTEPHGNTVSTSSSQWRKCTSHFLENNLASEHRSSACQPSRWVFISLLAPFCGGFYTMSSRRHHTCVSSAARWCLAREGRLMNV